MLKRTLMVSAIAVLCALPAMANDGIATGGPQSLQLAQAQNSGVDAKKLIGRDVKNMQNETIGEIESVHINGAGKVDAVVVSVGGFLGVGERLVAISWSELQIAPNGEKVVVNMTKDQLKAQAPYQYADQKYRGTVFGDSTPRPAPQARPGAPDDRRTMTDNARPRTGGPFNSAGDVAASALVGATVKNGQNETVGSIDDVYVDPNGNAKSVVISVGGFLGVGARHVNIPWSAVKVQRDGDRSLVVLINATKDTLKAMPEYKYGN